MKNISQNIEKLIHWLRVEPPKSMEEVERVAELAIRDNKDNDERHDLFLASYCCTLAMNYFDLILNSDRCYILSGCGSVIKPRVSELLLSESLHVLNGYLKLYFSELDEINQREGE